jgi:hypothetical protein
MIKAAGNMWRGGPKIETWKKLAFDSDMLFPHSYFHFWMVGLFDGLVQFPQHSHQMCLKKKSKSPGLQPWLPLPPQFPGRGMHSHGSPRTYFMSSIKEFFVVW